MKKENLENQENFKNLIKAFNSISPSEEQKTKMLTSILESGGKIKMNGNTFNLKKRISILTAVFLCVALTICVSATTIPSVNRLLAFINPEIAFMLQPIELSCEDEGIKVEVIAAMNDDEQVIMYLAVQDLTGDRIDETLWFRQFSLTGASMSGYEVIDYDETTKTALLYLNSGGMENLNGKKISIKFGNLLGKSIRHSNNTGICINDIPEIPDSETLPFDWQDGGRGRGEGDGSEEFMSRETLRNLKIGTLDIPLKDIDNMSISNIGFIDGELHVQIKIYPTPYPLYERLYICDSNGEEVAVSLGDISFGITSFSDKKTDYYFREFVFDVTNLNLEESFLTFESLGMDYYIEGNWETTFKIQSESEIKTVEQDIPVGDWTIKTVSLSPISIRLKSNDKTDDHLDETQTPVKIVLNMADGTTKEYESVPELPTDSNKELMTVSVRFDLPLDVENVESVTINETTINLK